MLFSLFLRRCGRAEIIGYFLYVFNHFGGVVGGHLRAVPAIYLVAVVLLGVVRRGDHNSREGVQLAYRKREHRHGVNVAELIRVYAVCRKHFCGGGCKLVAFKAGIVGDGNAPFHSFFAFGLDKFRKPLCCAPYGVNVHHIRAVADYAAHPRGTEFKLRAKAVFYIFYIILYGRKLGFCLGRKPFVVKPTLVRFFKTHIFLL